MAFCSEFTPHSSPSWCKQRQRFLTWRHLGAPAACCQGAQLVDMQQPDRSHLTSPLALLSSSPAKFATKSSLSLHTPEKAELHPLGALPPLPLPCCGGAHSPKIILTGKSPVFHDQHVCLASSPPWHHSRLKRWAAPPLQPRAAWPAGRPAEATLHTCLVPCLLCRHRPLRAAGGAPSPPLGAAWHAGGAAPVPAAAGGPRAAAGTAAAGWAEQGRDRAAAPAAEAGAGPSPAQTACRAPPVGLRPPPACAAGLRPRPAWAARLSHWRCWAPRQLLLPALSLQARHRSLQSHILQVLKAVRGGLLKPVDSGM